MRYRRVSDFHGGSTGSNPVMAAKPFNGKAHAQAGMPALMLCLSDQYFQESSLAFRRTQHGTNQPEIIPLIPLHIGVAGLGSLHAWLARKQNQKGLWLHTSPRYS